MKKESLKPQEQFKLAVGNAINQVFEDTDVALETANLNFAQAVKVAASEHGLGIEHIRVVLTEFASHSADLTILSCWRSAGSVTVLDVLSRAYTELLGESESDRVYKESVAP